MAEIRGETNILGVDGVGYPSPQLKLPGGAFEVTESTARLGQCAGADFGVEKRNSTGHWSEARSPSFGL